MFALREGEDGRQAEFRSHREHQAALAQIAQRDAEDVPNPLEEFACAQLRNAALKVPLDYRGIIEGRAKAPQFFMHLPSDEECRKALGEEQTQPPAPPEGQLRDTSREDEVLIEGDSATRKRAKK